MMSVLLQLMLPSLVVPILLSAILFVAARRYPALKWNLPIIWLPSYFWLVGWPEGIPQEANDWLWLLVVISLTFSLGFVRHPRKAGVAQACLWGVTLMVFAWPVLSYQPELGIVIELVVLLLVGGSLFLGITYRDTITPTLVLATCAGGLAWVTSLGGSVLVGQLAGALASVLAVFAVYEWDRGITKLSATSSVLMPLVQTYFALLLIARVFAGIPLISAVLLMMAPLVGLLLPGRFAFLATITNVSLALAWLLMTADSSSYY